MSFLSKRFVQSISGTGGSKFQPPVSAPNLTLILTSRCNFHCRHCLRSALNPDDLPLELAQKAILGIKRLGGAGVSLTGGEPLIYPHFYQVGEFIVSQNMCFNIVTNAYTFHEHLDWIRRYKMNISDMIFSLESSRPDKHDAQRKEGSFDKTMRAFAFCRKEKIKFAVISCIGRHNYDDVFDIGLLVKSKGARGWKLTTAMPCPQTRANELILDADKRYGLYTMAPQLSKVLRIPVQTTAAIYCTRAIQQCAAMNMNDMAVDSQGYVVRCCDVANHDSEQIRAAARIVSLKECSFEEAFKAFFAHMYQLSCQRVDEISDVAFQPTIDFYSCFYCLRQLAAPPQN